MGNENLRPPDCDPEIFKYGEGICVVSGLAKDIEPWVRLVARTADAKVDWHYSWGNGNVLHLGDAASRKRVLQAIYELGPKLEGQILTVGGPSLSRTTQEASGKAVATKPVIGPLQKAIHRIKKILS